jgi:C1A family cysteine protease
MKKNIQLSIFYACLLFASTLFGQTFIQAEKVNANEVFHVNTDQVLEVRLPSNPSTGYSWFIKDQNKLTCISPIGQERFESNNPNAAIGEAGLSIMRFIPTSKGSCDLMMVYKRPWESDDQIMDTYEIAVACNGAYMGGYIPEQITEPVVDMGDLHKANALPTSFTWRPNCTPVKDQQSCGSCWAFTCTASFEAVINIWDKVQHDFSEQFLVNCHTSSSGCTGGSNAAYSMYVSKGGVNETDLAYKAVNGTCGTYTYHEKAQSYKTVSNTVAAIKQAVYDYGPIYTAICAGSNLSSLVGTGILTQSDGTTLNHAVTIVGWDDAGGYWLVRNSWGSSWGDGGYFRAKFGVSGIGGASAYINYKGIIDHTATGIDNAGHINTLTVVPNPSDGHFTLNGLNEGDKVEVYDIVGKIVYQTVSMNSTHSVDLSNEDNGLYVYKVINTKNNTNVQGKLVKN